MTKIGLSKEAREFRSETEGKSPSPLASVATYLFLVGLVGVTARTLGLDPATYATGAALLKAVISNRARFWKTAETAWKADAYRRD